MTAGSPAGGELCVMRLYTVSLPALLRLAGAMMSGEMRGGRSRAEERDGEEDKSPWQNPPVEGRL